MHERNVHLDGDNEIKILDPTSIGLPWPELRPTWRRLGEEIRRRTITQFDRDELSPRERVVFAVDLSAYIDSDEDFRAAEAVLTQKYAKSGVKNLSLTLHISCGCLVIAG